MGSEPLAIGGRVGFGQRPSLLIVDMQNDFLDPAGHLDMGPEARAVIPQIARVLEAARRAGVPVVYTAQTHRPDFADGPRWVEKFTGFREAGLRQGTRGAEIVDELSPRAGERVIRKLRPSAFFGTELDLYLRSLGVDTTILTGCTTSGCVRATALDAFSYNYRVIVPEQCVTDRAKEPSPRCSPTSTAASGRAPSGPGRARSAGPPRAPSRRCGSSRRPGPAGPPAP